MQRICFLLFLWWSLLLDKQPCGAFQNFLKLTPPSKANPSNIDFESNLLSAIEQNNEQAVQQLLQNIPSSIANPAISKAIYGRWQLIYSTNEETSSPIQRTAFSKTDQTPIFQDIVVETDNKLYVNQIIQFSKTSYLTVNALASTPDYPMDGWTGRVSTGKILGLNLLGISEVNNVPDDPTRRIDFVFDYGFFCFNGFKVPYPVPFRLLSDWVKGWIDILYLSDTLRVAKGNKGTTFVLVKTTKIEP